MVNLSAQATPPQGPTLPLAVLDEGFYVPVPPPGRLRESLVYFLLQNQEVVYVGSTVGGLSDRVADHRARGRVFDGVFVLPVVSWHVRSLEQHYIQTLRPRLDSQHAAGDPEFAAEGLAVRRGREEAGLSVQEVAAAAACAAETVALWERGRQRPRQAAAIARAVDLDPDTCPECGGDLFSFVGVWLCLECARPADRAADGEQTLGRDG